MTREERENAIAILENEKKCVNRANKNDYCNRDCYNCELVKTDTEILTALDMAIKALQEQADTIPREAVKDVSYDGGDNWWVKNMREQIKAQADGEYISKQTVLENIDQWYEDKADIEDLIVKITYMPSVAIPSAEPREVLYSGDGYADGEMVYDMAECMNCGREFEYGDETWGCKFCPDCGQALKWEGEQE